MNLQTVNVSTGPVNISKQVQQALASFPISHRSKEFCKLYRHTTELLCQKFNIKNTQLITGSGTSANEAMIWQIKMLGNKGLILSNGEFGSRLIEQASRALLEFSEYNLLFGETFDIREIERKVQEDKIKWVLFCHCETSTGVVNDLDSILELCTKNNCLSFVDCMSTVGTCALDLSKITIATASSGKGLSSIPGLAIIFSNIEAVSSRLIPAYFDLGYYNKKSGIPFTISSNLLSALNVSIRQKLRCNQYELIDYYSRACFDLLSEGNMLPFVNSHSKVFTISYPNTTASLFVDKLVKEDIILSYESEYLLKRDLCQVAFFGYYQQHDLEKLLKSLKKSILTSSVC